MNANSMKTVVEAIFNSSINIEKEELEKSLGDVFDKVVSSHPSLKDMETFDSLVRYKTDNILTFLVGKLNPEIKDIFKICELSFLYLYYDYLNNHLSKIIEQKEGTTCCVDKSRWLIEQYRNYILNNTIPNMQKEKKCYWIPGFGTGQQWMNLCDGLVALYYGKPLIYLKTIKELMLSQENKEEI